MHLFLVNTSGNAVLVGCRGGEHIHMCIYICICIYVMYIYNYIYMNIILYDLMYIYI